MYTAKAMRARRHDYFHITAIITARDNPVYVVISQL
ncbi:hypothetical protein YPF_2873 [Yersinia pestis biovar Orientalis str. India 195]|nr:hypothetical protein YPF_2873 [Yersinia pestis biovar Orientalis str. India 195]